MDVVIFCIVHCKWGFIDDRGVTDFYNIMAYSWLPCELLYLNLALHWTLFPLHLCRWPLYPFKLSFFQSLTLPRSTVALIKRLTLLLMLFVYIPQAQLQRPTGVYVQQRSPGQALRGLQWGQSRSKDLRGCMFSLVQTWSTIIKAEHRK